MASNGVGFASMVILTALILMANCSCQAARLPFNRPTSERGTQSMSSLAEPPQLPPHSSISIPIKAETPVPSIPSIYNIPRIPISIIPRVPRIPVFSSAPPPASS